MRGCGIEWRGARRRKKKMAAGVIEFAVREPDGVASAVRKVTDSRVPTSIATMQLTAAVRSHDAIAICDAFQ